MQPVKAGSRYNATALRRLQAPVGADEPVLRALEVSSGPWPGFNGLQTLVLTETKFYRVQTTRFALRPNALLDVIDRKELINVVWRAGLLGLFGRLHLVADGRRRSFVSVWSEGADFAATMTPDEAVI